MRTLAPSTTAIPLQKQRTLRVYRRPQWSLARVFLLASLFVLLANGLAMGGWVGAQIEQSALQNDAALSSLYVDSIVRPYLQPLAVQDYLEAGDRTALDRLLNTALLRERIVALKIWSRDGEVLYSPNPSLIGRRFGIDESLAQALHGEVAAEITDLSDPENEYERQQWSRLVSVYVPVREDRGGTVIAVTEFYQLPDQLEGGIRLAQWRSWGVVAALTVATYLLLAGIVSRGSTTIRRQQHALNRRVEELRQLLGENSRLGERVRQAARRTTTLNEQALRRVSADLHDGPGQALALALMRMGEAPAGNLVMRLDDDDYALVRGAVQAALNDIRAISAGLLLPELDGLTPGAVIERVTRDHMRRTGTAVAITTYYLPERISMAVTIALFRTLQEALSNATRHGGGIGVTVTAWSEGDTLCLTVTDCGPGMKDGAPDQTGRQHLGLAGMRERARVLGGSFQFASRAGTGTTVHVRWPLSEPEDTWEMERNTARPAPPLR